MKKVIPYYCLIIEIFSHLIHVTICLSLYVHLVFITRPSPTVVGFECTLHAQIFFFKVG